MNREDIARMMRDSHLNVYGLGKDHEKFFTVIERFAALVASAERERLTDAAMKAAEKAVDVAIALEREACAKACEERGMVKGGEVFAARIRARGQA
jgi:hypothetical protein